MGIYDVLPKGSQVKLWNCIGLKKVGDTVASFDLEKYVVLLREGGYVIVDNGVITDIVEYDDNCKCKKNYCPNDFTGIKCFDKWGNFISSADELVGQFNDVMDHPYYEAGD